MDDRTRKEKLREEWEKLKQLSFKKKIEYIWNYYKIFIIGTVGIVFAISAIVQIIGDIQTVTELSVAYANSYAVQEVSEALAQDFKEYGEFDGKKQEVVFDTSYFFRLEAPDEMTMSAQTKIMAVIASKSMDVMVMPEEVYQYYLPSGAFARLEEVLAADLLEQTEAFWCMDKQEGDSDAKVYGLKLENNEKLKLFYGEEPVFIAVIGNSEHQDNAAKFIQYLLP